MSNTNLSGIEVNKVVIADENAKLLPQSVSENFQDRPTFTAAIGYGNPVGTTGTTNTMNLPFSSFEYHVKGTQTILAPVFSAGGLDIAMDQTANDGVEITNGISLTQRAKFTVGTDKFFFETTLTPADVSGSDDLAAGFRTAEAYQAAIDDYNNMAVLNVIAGSIFTETILNNAATVSTDTNVDTADTVAVTLRVEVREDGLVRYFVNGTNVTPASTFKFDSGDVVVPFVFFLQDTDLMDTLLLSNWETGLLEELTIV